MVEEIRYRSYAGAGRNLGAVNVRRLSENYNTMYVDRYTSSSQYMTWAPPPLFLRQQRVLGNVAPKEEVAEASTANNKPFKLWWNDPEMKRRGRVAKYKFYGAEGKMKISLKKGYRWIKKKCLEIVRNLWDFNSSMDQKSQSKHSTFCTRIVWERRKTFYDYFACNVKQVGSQHACSPKCFYN